MTLTPIVINIAKNAIKRIAPQAVDDRVCRFTIRSSVCVDLDTNRKVILPLSLDTFELLVDSPYVRGGVLPAISRIPARQPQCPHLLVAGDGKIYFFSETGETLVLEAGRELKVLARNDLGERVVSSPAVPTDESSFGPTNRWSPLGAVMAPNSAVRSKR